MAVSQSYAQGVPATKNPILKNRITLKMLLALHPGLTNKIFVPGRENDWRREFHCRQSSLDPSKLESGLKFGMAVDLIFLLQLGSEIGTCSTAVSAINPDRANLECCTSEGLSRKGVGSRCKFSRILCTWRRLGSLLLLS